MFEWSVAVYECYIIFMNTLHMQYKLYQVAVNYMVKSSLSSSSTSSSFSLLWYPYTPLSVYISLHPLPLLTPLKTAVLSR